MPDLIFHQFICRSDNYGLLLHDHKTRATAAIDAPDEAEIERQLEAKGWKLTHILTTHHHGDHVEGNLALQKRYGCSITGPRAEALKIPGIGHEVSGGDRFTWAGRDVRVMDCPGHTLGHIAYHMPAEEAVFAGDTLFSLGCGRVFEGTPEQMYHSVAQFAALPPATRLYCGHEYTQSNARFALTVEPGNLTLAQRAAEVEQLRAEGRMTCPSTIGGELSANPFLRTGSAEIRKTLGLEGASDAAVFAALRERKNSFR
ncbi:MAG: hydroxyacylglutathione hydrolase [Aestuariivirga sp.]|uniref:hydroxyacylglutathione hydrolase n=1 Tax=Aestuariivirga sp. TaxID=2650926 RepID=UPI0025C6C68E|nr:hydroxyacylglutathione hydrolase [Aestuariivirga sp.]MCA3561371.1 hydroxyacylglutathione hydrolase [Aestuariivirga sp.]